MIAKPKILPQLTYPLYWNHYLLKQNQKTNFEDFFYWGVFFERADQRDDLLVHHIEDFERYDVLRKSSITSFFSENLIDMPLCFKKSKSLYTKTFELPLFKFTNLIMRQGKRAQTLKYITWGFDQIFFKTYGSSFSALLNWKFLLILLSHTRYPQDEEGGLRYQNEGELRFTKHTSMDYKDYSSNPLTTVFSDFLALIEKYVPTFSFFVRRVNKALRKNSRGRSGKYTVTWKYVPLYKRTYLAFRWFLKDLKFQSQKFLPERIKQLFDFLFFNPNASFLLKVRKFVHKYVFKNFKKTLLKTLKTV